jgi:UTP-glucose-1-phosphate uridylyltransferase
MDKEHARGMDRESENLMEEYIVQVFSNEHQLIGTVRGRNQVALLSELEKLMATQQQVVEVKQREEVPL